MKFVLTTLLILVGLAPAFAAENAATPANQGTECKGQVPNGVDTGTTEGLLAFLRATAPDRLFDLATPTSDFPPCPSVAPCNSVICIPENLACAEKSGTCSLVNQGFSQCQIAPHVLYTCPSGQTVHTKNCDCACPVSGQTCGPTRSQTLTCL